MQDIFKEIETKAQSEKLAKEQFEEEERSIKAVLKTKEGRKTLSWILGLCGLDVSVTSSDALLTASLSGRRDVGLSISSRLKNADFELFQLLLKEENSGRSNNSDKR